MDLAGLARRLRTRWSLTAILLVNLVGIAFGFYYYVPQFSQTPVYLWPLVPDSPFAVLLMSVAIVLVVLDRDRPWLNVLGSAAMVKVGVWTAVVLAWFPEHFGFSLLLDTDCPSGLVFGCGNLNTILFYSHLGMALEPLVIADRLPLDLKPYAAVGGILALHDVLDYGWPVDYLGRGCGGLFPHTVPCDHLLSTFTVTLLLSAGALLVLGLLARQAARDRLP